MSAVVEEVVQPCPRCGADIRGDGRFSPWCVRCEWNVDPEGPEEQPGRLERVRRALARRYGEQLLAEVSAGGELRARRDASSVLAGVIALAVHGLTLALAAAGTWCVVRYWGGPALVLGIVLLTLAFALRPRPLGLPEDVPLLRRADAPGLFALVDEVARAAGTRGVDVIAVDGRVNASVMAYGLRGRRLLTLGMPLWEILSPQERIALLGHELGHYANGDARHGLVVGTAYRSLYTWRYVMAPLPDPTLVQAVANALLGVLSWLVRGVMMLLDRLTMRASQRAEYLADRTAARAGSTEAAVRMLDRLLLSDSVVTALNREVNAAARGGAHSGGRDDTRANGLWEHLVADLDSVPELERERLRRAGALRGHSVDDTHPPTHLRQQCLRVGEPVPATVTCDQETTGAIAAELAEARRKVARRILRDGLAG
ncbi:M48 family metallopeptidase [Streptomyces sp900105245]|uniref:M48 family metallopeptidase n=1 Tax=Streptomyces sp. 900105245 TaxID=3154379 RepID=UPI00332615DA